MKTVAQDFITLNQFNDIGQVHIQKDVFNSIAIYACDEEKRAVVEGHARKHIVSKIIDNQLLISLDVKIQYGQNVNEVSESLQSKIAQMIEHMTGFKCSHVDVSVIGFDFSAQ